MFVYICNVYVFCVKYNNEARFLAVASVRRCHRDASFAGAERIRTPTLL